MNGTILPPNNENIVLSHDVTNSPHCTSFQGSLSPGNEVDHFELSGSHLDFEARQLTMTSTKI